MKCDLVPPGNGVELRTIGDLLSEASGLMSAAIVFMFLAAVIAAYQLVGTALQYLEERTADHE